MIKVSKRKNFLNISFIQILSHNSTKILYHLKQLMLKQSNEKLNLNGYLRNNILYL